MLAWLKDKESGSTLGRKPDFPGWGRSRILESDIFHLLISGVRLQPSMTRSIVIFLGPLPGSSKTISFCGVFQYPARAKESRVRAALVAWGPKPTTQPLLRKTLPPRGSFCNSGSGKGCVQVSRLIVALAFSKLQLQVQQILGLFSSRIHFFSPP